MAYGYKIKQLERRNCNEASNLFLGENLENLRELILKYQNHFSHNYTCWLHDLLTDFKFPKNSILPCEIYRTRFPREIQKCLFFEMYSRKSILPCLFILAYLIWQDTKWPDDIQDLVKRITLKTPASQNGQTHSNNSSANYRRIFI